MNVSRVASAVEPAVPNRTFQIGVAIPAAVLVAVTSQCIRVIVCNRPAMFRFPPVRYVSAAFAVWSALLEFELAGRCQRFSASRSRRTC